MKIQHDRYVIATNAYPIQFDDGSGYSVDEIDKAMMWFTQQYAEEELKKFDEPEEYKIIKVKVSYEF
jgi:hypothetical protein